MHDALPMRAIECGGDLNGDGERFLHRQRRQRVEAG